LITVLMVKMYEGLVSVKVCAIISVFTAVNGGQPVLLSGVKMERTPAALNRPVTLRPARLVAPATATAWANDAGPATASELRLLAPVTPRLPPVTLKPPANVASPENWEVPRNAALLLMVAPPLNVAVPEKFDEDATDNEPDRTRLVKFCWTTVVVVC